MVGSGGGGAGRRVPLLGVGGCCQGQLGSLPCQLTHCLCRLR